MTDTTVAVLLGVACLANAVSSVALWYVYARKVAS